MRSTPPKICSSGNMRVDKRLLQVIIIMETDPINNAKAAFPSPIVLANANHPTKIVNTASTGPIHV
jgi:hypothetical protein